MTASFLKANLIMSAASKAIGAAFGFVRDSVIGATAETERYRVALGTMMGDQEKANKIIRDLDYGEGMFEGVRLSDFYGTANAIGGLQNMVTFGMEAEKAGDVLARLGDIAQGDSEAFVSMSNAMGQVFAAGKADSMKLRQFASKGFDVVGEVAKQTGKSREEIQKAGVTYEQCASALRSLTDEGGKYHGMLAKQMDTLGGVLKQFESLKAATAEAIGLGINDDLKDMLKYILEIARAGQDALVGKFVRVLKEVIHWIFQVIIMWEVLGYRLEDMGAFTVLKNFFEDLKTVAGRVLTGVMNLVVAVGKTFFHAFNVAYTSLRPLILALGTLIQKVLNFAAAGVQGLIPIINMIKPALTVIGAVLAVIVTGLGGIIDFLQPLAPIIIAIIAIIKIWTFVQWLLNAAMMANPIGLIVAAVIAAVALIVGLVMVVIKNWDKIAEFFKELGAKIADAFLFVFRKIGDFFKSLWGAITGLFQKIVSFVKDNAMTIINILVTILFFPAGIIMAVVRLIIKHWEKIKEFFGNVWEGIKEVTGKALTGIKNVAGKAWEGIKAGAGAAWSGIKKAAGTAWEGIKIGAAATANFMKDRWENIKEAGNKAFNFLDKISGGSLSKLRDLFFNIINNIKEFFTGLWGALKDGPSATIEYIKNAFFGLFKFIKDKFLAFIKDFIKGWEKVKSYLVAFGRFVAGLFQALVEKIRQAFQWVVDRAIAIWDTLRGWFSAFIEAVKGIWLSITDFFAGLWNGIVDTAMWIWNGLKAWFSGLVEGIKNIWNGIKGFFTGLWDAMMQGPTEAIEYIKNAFFGLFNTLQEKLFGFIRKIKEGWESVKGFFGGIAEGAVNLFTGGNSGGGLQPAYATAGASTVGPTSNYAYNSTGGNSTVNANTAINVNVPQGTPQEQSEAIARQINAQFDAKLAGSINSSRANIPSPEVRRR